MEEEEDLLFPLLLGDANLNRLLTVSSSIQFGNNLNRLLAVGSSIQFSSNLNKLLIMSSRDTKSLLQWHCLQEDQNVVSDSLDILGEATAKFGSLISGEHARMMETLIPHLDNQRGPVRKRAMHCLGGCGCGGVDCAQARHALPRFVWLWWRGLCTSAPCTA